jgi:hypothetical protein
MVALPLILNVLLILLFSRKNRYSDNFCLMALFCALYFFTAPLLYMSEQKGFYYAGGYREYHDADYLRASVLVILFFVGFFCAHYFIKNKEGVSNIKDRALEKGGGWFFYFLLVMSLIFSAYLYSIDAAEKSMLARQGVVESSWLTYFLSLLAVAASIFISLKSIEDNKSALTWISFLCLIVATVSIGGRTRLLLTFSIIAIYLFKSKVNRFSLILFSGFFFLIPVVGNLKEIMYQIVVNGVIPNFLDYYGSNMIGAEKVLGNFGHPVVSTLNSGNLLSVTGYRFFFDYIYGFLYYLKVFGLNLGYSLTHYNTFSIIGIKESIIPTGYIAFGYMQLGAVGVIFSGMFYRLVGWFGSRVYKATGLKSESAKFYFAFASAYSFYHGDVRIMVMTLMFPFVLLFSFSYIDMKKLKI